MENLFAPLPFLADREMFWFVTAETNGHPLVFSLPLEALQRGADLEVTAPPHPFSLTQIHPFVEVRLQLALAAVVNEAAPCQKGLARWAEFCVDAAQLVLDDQIAPSTLLPRLWTTAESELRVKVPRPPPPPRDWVFKLEDLDTSDLQKLAPGFVRERAVMAREEVPDGSLSVTAYHGQFVLVLRVNNRGMMLWPDCESTSEDLAAFMWDWETLEATHVLVLARDLSAEEITCLKARGCPPPTQS